ncbi:MAG: hypothetical protein RXP92_02060, partial [Candidatus Micrarchaeota archaeon]
LLNEDIETIKEVDKTLAEAIENIRASKVNLIPGYDGVFGIVDILNRIKKPDSNIKQKRISDFEDDK